jgi:hypothetical protein
MLFRRTRLWLSFNKGDDANGVQGILTASAG